MHSFWDQRYASSEYVYGTEPNDFFKEQIGKFLPGNLLLPAEGEGRNAVYAARLGWQVTAFDQSREAKKKAEKLCLKNKVQIDYTTASLYEIDYKPASFDCMALIYAHFPSDKRKTYHQKLDTLLSKDAILILEGFSKKHLQLNAGNKKTSGPKDVAMLFSKEEIKKDFPNYEILLLEEKIVTLNEGAFHTNKSAIIRFVGKKK